MQNDILLKTRLNALYTKYAFDESSKGVDRCPAQFNFVDIPMADSQRELMFVPTCVESLSSRMLLLNNELSSFYLR